MNTSMEATVEKDIQSKAENAKDFSVAGTAFDYAVFIGTDRLIFQKGSAVRERIRGYGEKYAHLHDFIFSLQRHGVPHSDNISDRVTAYATNTKTRFGYIGKSFFMAIKVVNKIADTISKQSSPSLSVGDVGTAINAKLFISTQDPFETGLVGYLLTLYARLVCGVSVEWNTDIHTDLYSSFFVRKSLLNRVRLLIASFVLPRADKIRVVSKRIEKSLTARGISESKITIRPIAIDPRILSIGESTVEGQKVVENITAITEGYWPIVMMAGRLTEEKEYHFALTSFNAYCNALGEHGLIKGKGPLLCIAGEGPLRPDLEKLKEKLFNGSKHSTASGNVHFLGSVAPEVLAYWYKKAQIFLHTSRFEGYGMVLAEAHALGLPVVTTDVGIASDLALESPNKVSLFAVGDSKSCINALIEHTSKLPH